MNFNTITFGAETPRCLEIHMSFVGQLPDLAPRASLRSQTRAHEAPKATFTVEW